MKNKTKQKLGKCPRCPTDNSVVTRIYTKIGEKDRKRVLYCINKGCGWRESAPLPEFRLNELINKERYRMIVRFGRDIFDKRWGGKE